MDWYSFLKFVALANTIILLFLVGVLLRDLRLIKSGLVYNTQILDLIIAYLISDLEQEEEDEDDEPESSVEEINQATLDIWGMLQEYRRQHQENKEQDK